MKCKICGNESETEECISCKIGSLSQMGLVAKEAYDKTHGLGLATEAFLKNFKDNAKRDESDLAIKEALLRSFETNEKLYGLGLGSISENIYSNMSNIQKESSLEIELSNTKNEITKLKKELEKSNKNEEEVKITNEKLKESEIKYENLYKDMETLKSDEKKIKETIEFIDKLPNEHLSKLKITIEHRIKVFNRIGFYSLLVSGFAFLGYFVSLILSLPVPTTAISYFNNVFFIVFPTIVASLQVIQKISEESDRDILVSINKLIDSILYKKDEKKVSDDLDINEVKTTLRDAALIIKTFNK